MDAVKRERLEEAGHRVTTVAEFLGLSTEESDLIEVKLALTYALRKRRKASGLSQTDLAEQIGSSQSRVAKMEAGNPNISLDLLVRALLATGMTRNGLANAIAGQTNQPRLLPMGRVSLPTMKNDAGHYKFDTSPKPPTLNVCSSNNRLPGVQGA